MTDYNDPVEARRELIASADMLRKVLSNLNAYAPALHLDGVLATQCDNAVFGEVYDGFKILLRELFPDDGVKDRHIQIIDAMFDSDFTVNDAAQYVADHNAPKVHYSNDEVREDLARYRAYLVALDEGVLNIDRLLNSDDPDKAREWLNDEINECLGALAYRNEPVNPVGSLIPKLLNERITRLADVSTDTYNDWQRAIDQTKDEAEAAGVEWDDAFVPEYIRERLEGSND